MKGKEKMETKQNKPMIVEIDEAKAELAQCINHIIKDRKVPCYFLEPYLTDMLAQIKMIAKQELAMAKEYAKGQQQVKEGDK